MVDYIGRARREAEDQPAPLLDCEQWESLLADKMDGTLAPELESGFLEHGHRCPGCAGLLEQAEQGRQWLKLLEEHAPAAPADLLSRILARTQGAGHETDYARGASALAGPGAGVQGFATLPGRWSMPLLSSAGLQAARRAHSARMLMTAAMAFFSVALTLSLAGVGFNSVHAAELRPQVVQASVFRSFYGTKKQVVSFYENLRLVYEVESRINETRTSATQPQAPAQGYGTIAPKAGGTQKTPAPASPGGRTEATPAPGSLAPNSPEAGSTATRPTAEVSATRNLSSGRAASGSGRVAAGKQSPQVEPVRHGMPLQVKYNSFFATGVRFFTLGTRSTVTLGAAQTLGWATLPERPQGTERKRI